MTTWSIPAPILSARAEARRRRALLPPGAWGGLESAIDRIVAARGTATEPNHEMALTRPTLVVFAGDHGIAQADISAQPAGTTARRAADLAAGEGIWAQLAAMANVRGTVINTSVDGDLGGTAVDSSHFVRAGSGRIDRADALTAAELERALAAGAAVADAEIDSGADLLIGAVCGVGVSTPSAVLASILTGMEPVKATTRGSGIDDGAWIRKCAAVRDARFRARTRLHEPAELLRMVGGADLAALTGFIAQAASRRTPVLVDDVPSIVCAILASRLAPGSERYVLAADTTTDRTEPAVREMLSLQPVADRRLGLGCGAGALMTVPLLRAALALLDSVAGAEGPVLPRGEHAIDAWNPELL